MDAKIPIKLIPLVLFFFVCSGAGAVTQIDYRKVKAISYVMADPGPHYKSLRGHGAIRISYGDEFSEKDIVVNYGANPNENDSALKRMIVATSIIDDPSGVVADSYRNFYENYKNTSRGVSTFVLKLDQQEKKKIIEFMNWELRQGKGTRNFDLGIYNCATMVTQALNSGLKTPIHKRGMDFPDSLAKLLLKKGLVRQYFHDGKQAADQRFSNELDEAITAH